MEFLAILADIATVAIAVVMIMVVFKLNKEFKLSRAYNDRPWRINPNKRLLEIDDQHAEGAEGEGWIRGWSALPRSTECNTLKDAMDYFGCGLRTNTELLDHLIHHIDQLRETIESQRAKQQPPL